MTHVPLPLDQGLFGRLRRDAGAVWEGYVAHDFVRALGQGTLQQAAFRHFLVQDYLFLIHFARAHALAGFKATQLADIRAAAAAVSAIVDVEMPLHVSYCAGWGLSEEQMAAAPEALETMAYTRFVLERGLAGDLLDLQVSLAPCLVGYGESGERLLVELGDAARRQPVWRVDRRLHQRGLPRRGARLDHDVGPIGRDAWRGGALPATPRHLYRGDAAGDGVLGHGLAGWVISLSIEKPGLCGADTLRSAARSEGSVRRGFRHV